jgi:hypothetical protein
VKKIANIFFFATLLLSLIVVICCPRISAAEDNNCIVYVTNTGNAYHLRDCHHLRSVNAITLRDATINGYWPCTVCNPPIYTGDLPEVTEPERPHPSGSGSGTGSSSGGTGSYNGHGNGSGSGSGSGSSHTSTQPTTMAPSNTDVLGTTNPSIINESRAMNKTPQNSSEIWIPCILLFFTAVVPFVFSVCVSIADAVKEKKESTRKNEQLLKKALEERQRFENGINGLIERLINLREKNPTILESVRNQIYCEQQLLDKTLEQRNVKISTQGLVYSNDAVKPYGAKFTVFISKHGDCYHRVNCKRRGIFGETAHVTAIHKKYRPCSYCNPNDLLSEWMHDCKRRYQRISELQNAYNVMDSIIVEKKLGDNIARLEGIKKRFINDISIANESSRLFFVSEFSLRYLFEKLTERRVKVNVLNLQRDAKNRKLWYDCVSNKLNLYCYTDTWIVGVNLDRSDYKIHRDRKTHELYFIISYRSDGHTDVALTDRKTWEQKKDLYLQLVVESGNTLRGE